MKNKRGQIQPVAVAQPEAPAEVTVPEASAPVETAAPVTAAPVENQNQVPPKRSKKWLWIIIALIAIGVIGALVWFLFIGGEGSVVGSGIGSSVPTPPKFPS